MPHDNLVLIINAGSQYLKLIDRTVRKLNVETVIVPSDISHERILKEQIKGIIISGSPASVLNKSNLNFDEEIFELGIPILGICFGMQLIVESFGGKVEQLDRREDSQTVIDITETCALYDGLESKQTVLLTHGDCCVEIPSSFKINAISSSNVAISISNDSLRIYGVQYHPEVNLTLNGSKIIENFLFKICNMTPCFTLPNRLDTYIADINLRVKENSKIIILVSGGVDSTICAILLHRALPNHVIYCVLVDHGYLRKDEARLVKESFTRLGIDIIVLDEFNVYSNANTMVHNKFNEREYIEEVGPLKQTIISEHKRKIIGDCFMQSLRNIVADLNLDFDDCMFVQGTLRTDLIESGSQLVSSSAETIKTHHNDTQSVRLLRSRNQIIEPLKDLHKDEVRELAALLDIPSELIKRHPFPGPGLAIRIICSNGKPTIMQEHRYDLISLCEFIANYSKHAETYLNAANLVKMSLSAHDIENLKKATSNNCTFTATLLPILSVGVQGDGRSYKNPVALSTDSKDIDWLSLYTIAQIIPKICMSINRVLFVLGDRVKFTIPYTTETYLTPDVIEFTREADHIVHSMLEKEGALASISQCPVICIPIHFDNTLYPPYPSLRRSIVLRPFISTDFMTGVPALPQRDIEEDLVLKIKDELLKLPGISRVLYDLTSKPPGTTEWE